MIQLNEKTDRCLKKKSAVGFYGMRDSLFLYTEFPEARCGGGSGKAAGKPGLPAYLPKSGLGKLTAGSPDGQGGPEVVLPRLSFNGKPFWLARSRYFLPIHAPNARAFGSDK